MADIGDRFATGLINTQPGVFVFDVYLDGTVDPAPTQAERVLSLAQNERFPPIRSTAKACFWRLEQRR